MLIKGSSGLGPKCQLCTAEQLEQCLALLNLSERAKASIRDLFASGEVNPIIESYLQKNCNLFDNTLHKSGRGLRARISLQVDTDSTGNEDSNDNGQAVPEPPTQVASVGDAEETQSGPVPQSMSAPPFQPQQTVDELVDTNSTVARKESYILTVLDTQHRIHLPEHGAYTLGSWDALDSPYPDVNLLYDDRRQHSVSARHARISIKDNVHYIEDLESQHGTWLNDKQLEASTPRPLKLGDTLCLGRCVLQVTESPGYWSDPDAVYTIYTTTSGRDIPLPRHGELVMGRGDPTSGFTPDIDLADGENLALGISRRHAALRCWMHTIEISDLGSTNGTEIEGIRIPPGIWVSVRPGQHINLGGFGLALQVRKSKITSI